MRIKVDISEFFDDEKKQAVVNVNTEETATVHDVVCKIIRMFKLSTRKSSSEGTSSKENLALGLFGEGFYIHPSETSTVLQDIDILKLKALANVKEGNADSKKKKRKTQWMVVHTKTTLSMKAPGPRKTKLMLLLTQEKKEMAKAHNEEEDLGVLQKTRKSTRKGVIMFDNGSTQEERNVKKSPSKRDKEEFKECAYVVATEQKMEKKKKGKIREIYDEVNKKNATQSEKKSMVKLQESEDDDAGDITRESLQRDRHHTESSTREEVEVKVRKGCKKLHKEQLKSTSQEKDVSTSNMIHMNSEDDSEGSSTPKCEGNNTPNQGEIKIIEADSLSSWIGEPVLRRARRKGKHNKGKKRPPENEVECIPVTSQGFYW
ncbi:hypothetical protein SK128_004757 [Halocaridina rubra]|uniref:Coilin n=1 Tax=Halocaridina rubra TaxID=373956 RepID=A0AAN8WN42_HALRR